MTDFGKNLKSIRVARGLSQDALAEFLGTSKQVISRYENGLRSPKVSVVADYSDKLGVSIAELTGGASASAPVEEQANARPDMPAISTPEEAELVGLYRELNATGQAALMGTARGLAANPDMKKGGTSGTVTA